MLRKILGLLSLLTVFALIAWADSWDKKTILKVSEPVQVPGAVLQPGTYVIKLVDSLADRHIVRIMNQAEDEVITTFLAIPNYRLTPTGDSRFEFWETPAGNPRAMRAWFYPGDNFGQEFAYPEGMSAKVAPTVPTTTAKQESELSTAPFLAAEKPPEKPLIAQTFKPAPPPPAPVAAAPAPEPPSPPAPAELPATASFLPALGLAALFAIAAGFALRLPTSGR